MSSPSSTAQPRIPSATYRVQMHKDFTFAQAREIVPYLHALGISDLYTSPFFQASPGSTHGYDIVDHNHLNPEIGTEAEFDAMVAALHEHGMGLIADFVPNHMGIAETTNGWWMDVLENGPSSLTAKCFDIDWHPLKRELENKVLLPILGDQYGRVLEKGELKLSFEGGSFYLNYYAVRLPINPRQYGQVLSVALAELQSTGDPAASGIGSLHGGTYHISELQSIMTQLEKMPPRTTTDPALIAERAREKEVAKVRLEQLCVDHPQVGQAIAHAIDTIQGKPGDVKSFDRLDALIDAQAYRLSYWRVAAEEINYRRFFDINQLAAIRVEDKEVFNATHQLVWKLLEKGAVTGLRIDHPDGLYDPREYFRALQENYARLTGQELPGDGKGIYLLGEKILSGEETLREDWLVHGTTGYDFTTHVTQLLVDPSAEASFSETYQQFIRRNVHFPTLVYEKKRQTMTLSLANDINVLGFILNRLSERNRLYRDFTLNALTTTVREVVACFPVYRTYLTHGQPPSATDRAVINRAVTLAKRRNPGTDASIFDFLRDILMFKFPPNTDAASHEEHERFVLKFQQCTGPIMAKGLEDTAFYIFNRLVALNEVGGEPQHFGGTPEKFHRTNEHNSRRWPHTLLATSTHDTKRAEDTRARVAALSEMPGEWRENLRVWSAANAAHKSDVDGEQAPSENEEYLIYQILVGTWPIHLAAGEDGARSAFAAMSDEDHAVYVARIQDYMTKAIKEAKVNSSWIQPNEPWDEATRKFVAALLRRGGEANSFLETVVPLAERAARLGVINSLTQTMLKLTVPGVPDIYQGCDVWDYSLVDPDNRRPVDYGFRKKMLDALPGNDPRELLATWPDGRVKLFVLSALLRHRRDRAEFFQKADYRAVEVTGKHAESVVAFVREHAGELLLVVVPRLSSRVGDPPVGEAWADTALTLADGGPWRDLFTGREVQANALSEVLADFPCAGLVH